MRDNYINMIATNLITKSVKIHFNNTIYSRILSQYILNMTRLVIGLGC